MPVLKVLHVIPSLSAKHGGPSIALPLMAKGLVEAGVEVDVATTDDDGPGGRLTVPLGERRERDGWGAFYFQKQSEFYKVSLPFRRWISEHAGDYDLVHVHALFSYTSVCALRVARARRIPYIVRPLGVLNRWGMENRRPWLKRLAFRFIEGPLLERAAAVHYTSRQEQTEAEESGVRAPGAVIPLGIDLSEFEHLPGPAVLLDQFPEAKGRPLVLFLSRLDQKKGLDLLLPAFAQIAGNHPRALLLIVGSGEANYVASLKSQAAHLGVADKVIWTGSLQGTEKLSALAAATVFVLPSYSENFGIALLEAMAAGLPCLTTNGVALWQDAQEHDAAIVVDSDASQLAGALDRLLSSEALRQRLSDSAKKLVRERFTIHAMASSLVKLYEEVCSQRRLNKNGAAREIPLAPASVVPD